MLRRVYHTFNLDVVAVTVWGFLPCFSQSIYLWKENSKQISLTRCLFGPRSWSSVPQSLQWGRPFPQSGVAASNRVDDAEQVSNKCAFLVQKKKGSHGAERHFAYGRNWTIGSERAEGRKRAFDVAPSLLPIEQARQVQKPITRKEYLI